jgi:hypothetical protein
MIVTSGMVINRILAGRYLNLPVVDPDGRLVATVDVLKLTYATLEQVSPSGFPNYLGLSL